MTKEKFIRETLDAILNGNTPFSIQIISYTRDGKPFAAHYVKGMSAPIDLACHLQTLRQYCSSAATPETLAIIANLEEDIRQLGHMLEKDVTVAARAGHA